MDREDLNSETTVREHSLDELAKGLANHTIARRKVFKLFGGALLGGALASIPGANAWAQSTNTGQYTRTFLEEEYSTTGTNPYFIPLQPGSRLVLEGREDRKDVSLTITVLDDTEVVDGVETRVMEERETIGGELFEVSRNFVVIGNETNSVFYFGEHVDFYKNGEIVGHEGSWRSGVDEAKFGLLMPGIVLLGSRYFQEVAPGVALDRAEHVSMSEQVETPAETFENCLKVRETTRLEPNVEEFKFYAKGVGLIKDYPLKLTSYEFPAGT